MLEPAPAEPVQITEKGRDVIESGPTLRQAHEIETGCTADDLCKRCLRDVQISWAVIEKALRARIAELEAKRDDAQAETVQAVADLEPIDALRGQLDIARSSLEDERRRAEIACLARNDLAAVLRAARDRIVELEAALAAAVDIARSNSHALDEALAKRGHIGYVTGYRDAEGEWWVGFDGTPFTTHEEATDDLHDACNDVPGVDWRTLTVYDETGEPYQAQQEGDRA